MGQKQTIGYTARLRNDLVKNLRPYFGELVENISTGIKSRISKKTADKMGSEKAVEKSKLNGFSVAQHFEVANNIVRLYQKSSLIESRADKNNDPNIRSIKRFVAPVKLEDGTNANAYITVKEAVVEGHRIYSVEVMEINKASVKTNALGDATAIAADSSI